MDGKGHYHHVRLQVDSGDARIVSGVRRFYGQVEWNSQILIKNIETGGSNRE
jgi:hypothetical protein